MSIYLDYNSTTPPDPAVVSAITSTLSERWQNPSSAYSSGKAAKCCIEEARSQVAAAVNVSPDGIIFTSSGTESNAIVFHTFTQLNLPVVPHIVTTNVEHPSVLQCVAKLKTAGLIDVTVVPVDVNTGVVRVEDIVAALRPTQTVLVSLMLANNETGVIMPVDEIVRAVRHWEQSYCSDQVADRTTNLLPTGRVFVHTDVAQAVGKIPVDLTELGVDYASIVGHKMYGPRIACLYVYGLNRRRGDDQSEQPSRSHAPLVPMFYGGGQEHGNRAGTENTAMIVGLGKAAELVIKYLPDYMQRMSEMHDYLLASLCKTFSSANNVTLMVFGVDHHKPYSAHSLTDEPTSANARGTQLRDHYQFLPNTLNIRFHTTKPINSGDILSHCPQLAVSRGAACHSSHHNALGSTVLMACGYSQEEAAASIRLSCGRETTKQEIDDAVRYLKEAVNDLI